MPRLEPSLSLCPSPAHPGGRRHGNRGEEAGNTGEITVKPKNPSFSENKRGRFHRSSHQTFPETSEQKAVGTLIVGKLSVSPGAQKGGLWEGRGRRATSARTLPLAAQAAPQAFSPTRVGWAQQGRDQAGVLAFAVVAPGVARLLHPLSILLKSQCDSRLEPVRFTPSPDVCSYRENPGFPFSHHVCCGGQTRWRVPASAQKGSGGHVTESSARGHSVPLLGALLGGLGLGSGRLWPAVVGRMPSHL